jgi:N-acylneuraminate cytidylyltransferase
MKTVAIILARGGSKGVPKKNIQTISGEPLISYAINSAKWSNVDEVWVSSDSTAIKNISRGLGAKVLSRPSELATDESPSEDALLHFAENVDFDVVVFIQPTSPLLRPSYIDQGLSMMKDHDSVFSVYEEHWLPRWDKDLNPINFENSDRPRRQDRDEVFVENGAFYITTKEKLLESKLRVSGKLGVVKMLMQDSFQIDTQEDFELVEKFL